MPAILAYYNPLPKSILLTLNQFGVLSKRYRNTQLPTKIPEYTKNTEITCNFGKWHTWVNCVSVYDDFINVSSNRTDTIYVPKVGLIRNYMHLLLCGWNITVNVEIKSKQ